MHYCFAVSKNSAIFALQTKTKKYIIMKKANKVQVRVHKAGVIHKHTLVYKLKAKLFVIQLKKKGYKAWLSKSDCIIIDSSLPNRVAKKIIDLGYSKGLGVDIY